MPSINKCIVLLTLALSAVAANHGQHMARGSHHDIAARAPVAAPEVAQLGNVQKRGSNSKRCKARSSSSSSSSTSTSHSTSHSSSATPKPTSSKKEANADTEPTSTSSSSPKWIAPLTSSIKVTPTTSSKAAASSVASGGGGGGGLTTGGVGTYFTQNGVEGACGKVNPDSAIICALQTSLYAGGKNCGKQVEITNTKNGKTVTVTVADECPTCDNEMSIDLSVGAFQALGGTVDEGQFSIAFKML